MRADPFQRFGAGGQATLMQGVRGYTLHFTNVIQYLSPNIAGVSGRLYVAAGEGEPTGKAYAASIDYAKGPLYVGAFYEQTRTVAALVGLTGAPVKSETVSAAAVYDFKVVKLHGQIQNNRIDRLDDVNVYLAGIKVPLGLGEVRASYSQRSATNADASLVGVGYLYFLSKRTNLYTNVARLSNDGTAAFRMGPAFAEQVAAGAVGPAVAGQETTGVQFGVRHFF